MPRSNNIKKDEEIKDPVVKPKGRSTTRQRSEPVKPKRERGTAAKAALSPEKAAKVVRRIPRILERYRNEILPTMIQEFGYKSPLEAPKLQRVVLNIGLGEALLNANALESAKRDLTLITGQMPVITRAHKSIAGFKIRQGMGIGIMVTLRGSRMYDFLDKLINAVFPRIIDFR